jgi:hypothetical protein
VTGNGEAIDVAGCYFLLSPYETDLAFRVGVRLSVAESIDLTL